MPCMNVKEFLDNQGIDYEIILHRRADTARGTASASHIPASKLAKTVIVKVDGGLHMAVVPANQRLDLRLLKAATGSSSVAWPAKRSFRPVFPAASPGPCLRSATCLGCPCGWMGK
jgi:Ala-tRNA(Pro) deacylase